MGEYTNGQLYVWHTTPEEVLVFLEFIADNGLGEDWETNYNSSMPKTLKLGACYGNNDASSTGLVINGTGLAEKAPHSAYTIWVDPKYEWLGDLEMHHPDLGLFRAQCDGAGQPVFGGEEILALIDKSPEDFSMAQLKHAISRAMGKPWEEAFKSYADESGTEIPRPPTCQHCEEFIVQRSGIWLHWETERQACHDVLPMTYAQPNKED